MSKGELFIVRSKNGGLEEAIVGCLKDDNRSKETIYKSFYGILMGVVLRYVNDRDDSKEIVNDSFMRIFKYIPQFSFPKDNIKLQKAFRSWAARIASRMALDFLKRQRAFVYIDDLCEQNHPCTKFDAVSQLNVQDILKLLNHLPVAHRLVFNLYEIEGFSHEEISKMLDIPESSCRVFLSRAKNKMRVLYSKTTQLPNYKERRDFCLQLKQ